MTDVQKLCDTINSMVSWPARFHENLESYDCPECGCMYRYKGETKCPECRPEAGGEK